jgi:Undecaprenyl-phosphate galactose phosphotransferase WbaP
MISQEITTNKDMNSNLLGAAIAVSEDGPAQPAIVTRPFGAVTCLALSDIISVLVAIMVAGAIRDHVVDTPAASVSGVLLPALVLVCCSFTAAGLYRCVSVNPVEEIRLSSFATTLSFLGLWSGTFMLHDLSQSRLIYVLAYLFALIVVPAMRLGIRNTFAHNSWWGCSVVILGCGSTAKLLLTKLKQNPALGLKPLAILDDDPAEYSAFGDSLIYGPLSHCLELASRHSIPYGIICMPELSRDELLYLLDRYGRCFGHVLVIPNLVGITSLGVSARELDGIVGLEVRQELLRKTSQLCKRALDLSITMLLAPLISLTIALAAVLIKVEDGGPVFYGNLRVGKDGKVFRAWKLRSMLPDSQEVLRLYLDANPQERLRWCETQKLRNDPRLTRIGRYIRKSSIDELPQFWNVMRGEMSVVGPRPILSNQIEMYGDGFRLYKQVRPGITGLWQVSGRNELPFSERVKLDQYVIQNWSVWLDIYIMARTFGVVLTAKGAY